MNSQKEKPKVIVFVNENSKATTILLDFIGKNIDSINKRLVIKIIKINKKNIEICKRKGIKVAPTLIYNDKHITGIDNIVRVLSPPQQSKDSFGQGYLSPDEYVHSYHDSILNTGGDDDEDDDMNPDVRDQVLKQKMAALQKRRPQMSDNVDSKHKIRGGRKMTSAPPRKSSFATDDEFFRETGVDNIQKTPSANYADDTDGDLILEEWYLSEANASGKKVGKVVSNRR